MDVMNEHHDNNADGRFSKQGTNHNGHRLTSPESTIADTNNRLIESNRLTKIDVDAEKMDEKLGTKSEVERMAGGDALPPEQLENKKIVNVSVYAGRSWDQSQNYVDKIGAPVVEVYSDNLSGVNEVSRDKNGKLNNVDSEGRETSMNLDKDREMCYGDEVQRIIDPSVVIVSKKSPVNDT